MKFRFCFRWLNFGWTKCCHWLTECSHFNTEMGRWWFFLYLANLLNALCIQIGIFNRSTDYYYYQLPPQVTSTATIEGFRKSLKTHLYGGLEVLWFGLTPPQRLSYLNYVVPVPEGHTWCWLGCKHNTLRRLPMWLHAGMQSIRPTAHHHLNRQVVIGRRYPGFCSPKLFMEMAKNKAKKAG